MSHENPEMVPVPIPTEVPAPPRLENIPLDILHSATVELLIQQNEDLSSRLKVNIRRNSQLELKILEQEREIKDLNRKRENVLAQIEIIKEKENLWRSQKEEKDRRMASLEQESDLLETRYNELYTTSQQKNRNSSSLLAEKQKEVLRLERKIEIFLKVRSRAKEKLRALLVDLASGLHRTQKSVKKSESSRKLMERNIEKLQFEFQQKEENYQIQFERFKKTSEEALRGFDLKLDKAKQKIAGLNREKQDLREEITDLTHKLHAEQKNRNKISQLTEELNQLKNERIAFKREMQEAVAKVESSREAEKLKADKAQEELKTLQLQHKEQTEVLTQCESRLIKISKENREVSDQLSAVQKLWVEAQDKLEKMELQCESLEKINKQLSRNQQKEKVQKATKRAQEPLKVEINETPQTEPQNDEFQSKIKDVFASQYRTISRGPDMDV